MYRSAYSAYTTHLYELLKLKVMLNTEVDSNLYLNIFLLFCYIYTYSSKREYNTVWNTHVYKPYMANTNVWIAKDEELHVQSLHKRLK